MPKKSSKQKQSKSKSIYTQSSVYPKLFLDTIKRNPGLNYAPIRFGTYNEVLANY